MKLIHAMRRFFQPTLVRRILVAQCLFLTLLWVMGIGYVFLESKEQGGVIHATSLYTTLQSVVETTEGRPQARLQLLQQLDLTIREEYGRSSDPKITPSIVVRSQGEMIYHSPGAPLAVTNKKFDHIEETYHDNMRWLSQTRRSMQGTEVTLIMPGQGFALFVYLNSRGYFLLPLLISLPFLLLPAWLSIRVAMRPWRLVVDEIATRGPKHLAPLTLIPQHQELRSLVETINALLQRVHDSAERERSFIADAAHELRTPVAAMRINVEAMQSQATDPRQRELLTGILNSCDRAGRMIGQLLLLMRSEAKDVTPTNQLQLGALLQDRIAILSALAYERDIDLELDAADDILILGKREGLVSLIDNLVGNAIKYSPQDGTVTVRAGVSDGSVMMTVSDQGSGIAPALRERVFDRFFRAPDQTQSGSGLGLTIARSVVLQHGGTIALDDTPEGGLLVVVLLPLASEQTPLVV